MKWIRSFILILFVFPVNLIAQEHFISNDFLLLERRLNENTNHEYDRHFNRDLIKVDNEIINGDQSNDESEEYPEPRSVLFKSMMIPGWGQVENGQIWKVPIIYGMFAGVGFYAGYLNNQYQDYRAAYYNLSMGEDSDFRFGPTPERLQGISANQLQNNRDILRNQRDFMFVVMGLAYGLNILDAYVFAHMRSFDVSDDLSARTVLQPAMIADGHPGFRVSITLYSK